ncbi:hypothetical protein VNO77_18943 [Canavalia gladiata]|uniref:Uncharacterized protein n=1 Tax=Canavalia gladiata TaxID=3824 RepID=A0AAN9LLQ1_CANGL
MPLYVDTELMSLIAICKGEFIATARDNFSRTLLYKEYSSRGRGILDDVMNVLNKHGAGYVSPAKERKDNGEEERERSKKVMDLAVMRFSGRGQQGPWAPAMEKGRLVSLDLVGISSALERKNN